MTHPDSHSDLQHRLRIIEADLNRADHQQAIVELLDDYARLPHIKGDGLPEQVQRELIPGLQQLTNCFVVLAYVLEATSETGADRGEFEAPVGVAVCFIGYSTFAARPLINIHDLAVRAEYRGSGVGRKILSHIDQKGVQMGCCKITLEVNQLNHGARRLYDRFGFDSAAMNEESSTTLFCTKRITRVTETETETPAGNASPRTHPL